MSVGPATPAPRPRRLWRIAAALALLGVVLFWVDPARVAVALRDADPVWALAGLVSSTLANVASAWRWRALAGWLGHRAPLGWALPVYFRGVAANVVMPGAVVGGDMLRAWGLHRRGMPVLEAGASVVLDRLSGLWVLVALGLLALGSGVILAPMEAPAGWRSLLDGVGLAPAALAWLAVSVSLLMAGLPYALLRWIPAAGWSRWRGLRWWSTLAGHAPGRHYGQQLAGSLAVQIGSVTTLYCGAQALGLALPWWALAVAAVPIFVFATLPVSFGGWGTREAAAVAVLAPLAVPAHAAVALSVLYGLYPVVQALLALLPLPPDPADRVPRPG